VRNVIPDVGDRLSFAVRTNHSAAVCKSLSGTLLAECTYSERALFLRLQRAGLTPLPATTSLLVLLLLRVNRGLRRRRITHAERTIWRSGP